MSKTPRIEARFFLFRLDLNNRLNLHGCIQRQCIRPNGTTRVIPNRLIEHLHYNVGTAVHYQVLMFEFSVRVDYSEYLMGLESKLDG